MLLMLLAPALSGLLAQSPASATPIDVSRLTVGAPAVLCELDMALMKGEVRRLSWSPDGAYIHIQTIERETLRDYIVTLPEGIVSVAFGGITFGWGPAGSGAIAFVDDKGHVALFDRDKHKRTVAGTQDGALPGWSPDGTRIAFVQKDGRRKYRLMMSTIAQPRT